jgi:hypothetical protein
VSTRAAAVVVAAALLAACGGSGAAERAAVRRYIETLRPLAKDGGRVVVEGVRPGLSDIERGRVTGAVFRSRAQAWRSEMERVQTGFAATPPPARLKPAAALFDESLRGYIAAIDRFVMASYKTGDALKAAITAAVPTAEQADKTYDRAIALVNAERKRVGLPDSVTL